MIHLDTSFLVRAFVRSSPQDRQVRTWLEREEPLGMSAVAWTEFLCGPLDERQLELAVRVVGNRVPFDEQDAALAALLFNREGRRRGSLADCMIAAAAIQRGAPLATANPSDFQRFRKAGLELA